MDLGFQILRKTQLQPLILGPCFKQQTQISARRNIQFSRYRNPSLNHTMFDDDGDDWWSSSWWLFCVCKYIHIILDNRYDIIIYIFTQYHNYHNCLYFGNGGGFWRFLIFQHLKNNRGYWVQPSPVLDSPGNLKSKGPRSMLSGACCSRTAWR